MKKALDELIARLKRIDLEGYPVESGGKNVCPSKGHEEADKLLLKYIGDIRMTRVFNKIEKWYG